MDTSERKSKHQKQTGELYRAIGRLVVNFEHVCETVRIGIMTVSGLFNTIKQQRIAHIIMVRMMAAQLSDIYSALLGEVVPLSDDDQRVLDDLFRRFKQLVERRNEVVHNTWYIGWASPESDDFSKAPALKWGRGRRGATLTSVEYDAEIFDALADEAEQVGALFRRLSGAITIGPSISEHFRIDPSGRVDVPE